MEQELNKSSGTISLELSGVNIEFPFQTSGDRIYIEVGNWPLLLIDEVVRKFQEFVTYSKKNLNRTVILTGRRVGQCQLRPDLRDVYTGLPDDFTIDMAYGMSLRQKPERIKINGEDFDIVSLSEIGARKAASIGGWRKDVTGGIYLGTAPGRESDVVDFYLISLTLGGEKSANEWAMSYELKEFVKTKLPDRYEQMKASGIFDNIIWSE